MNPPAPGPGSVRPDPRSASDREVCAQRIRLHLRASAQLPLLGFAIASGLVMVLWPEPSVRALTAWFVAVCAAIAVRGLVALMVRRRVTVRPDSVSLLWALRGSVALHGLAWGGLLVLLLQLPETAHDPIYFAVMVMVVGTVLLGPFDAVSSAGFAAPATLPVLLHLWLAAADHGPLTIYVIVTVLVLSAATALRGHRAFVAGVEETRRKESLRREYDHAMEALLRATELAGVVRWDYDLATGTLNLATEDARVAVAGRDGAKPLDQVLERLQPDSAQAFREALQACLVSAGALSLEVQVTPGPGPGVGRVLLLSGGAVVEQGKVIGARGVSQDITALRQREREVADQARLRQQLLDNTEQGIWFLDNEGRTTDLNAAMCGLLGRPREAVIGRSVFDFFEGEDLAVLHRELERRRQGHKQGYEISIARPDGTRVDCFNNATPIYDSQGRKLGSVGMWTDLTQVKTALAEVESGRARRDADRLAHAEQMQTLLNAFPGHIAAVDEDGRYVFVNDRIASLLGQPAGRIIGRLIDDFLPPERVKPLREEFSRLAAGEILVDEQQVTPPGGRPLVLRQTRVAGTPDDKGRRKFYVFGLDITDLAAAQEATQRAREEAERASLAKSNFLSQVSHELRTPMNAILGFAQLLETDEEHPLKPSQRLQVHEILLGAQHLLDLINGLLDLGRIEAGGFSVELRPVALADLLKGVLSMVGPVARKAGINLPDQDEVPAGLTVMADATRLTQILINLVGNGIKYNRPGGEVRVLCHAATDRAVIEITDTGQGLTEEEQSRLFEPFQRLRAEGSGIEGTGIGLALSRRLVEAMGGVIGVDSVPGQGSTFWLELPYAAQVAPATAQAGEPAPVPAAARDWSLAADAEPLRVLYIDDNPVNVLVMQAMIMRLPGLRMLSAEDGEPGLALALKERPALILSDIQMPGMDGFELLRRLRELPETRDIPVVAISADALPDTLARGRAAGFDDYITKPVQMSTVHEVVARLIGQTATTR